MKVKNQYLKILEYLHLHFNKWPSKQYKLWVSLVLWKHNNEEHCWPWQWSRRRSLTPSTKRVRHRGSLLKGGAVQGVLYQSILNAKLTGRKKLGRKMCTSNRDDRKFENTVKQSWFKHLGELHKSELKLESVHQESPCSDIFRKRATEPLLKQKHRQKHLTWAKEKKNWTVAQLLFSDERHRIHVAWSPVWSFHSQWWFGLPCHLLVLVHCVFWSPVNASIYQDILEHFMLPSADKLYGDADFIFQQDLAPAHTAKGNKSWFSDHGVTVLDWPANSPELSFHYLQEIKAWNISLYV